MAEKITAKEDKSPNIFYKYMHFNALNIISLCTDTLFFSDPAKFNDPHDCRPNVVADIDTIQLQILFTELIKHRIKLETVESLSQSRFPTEKAEIHANRLAEYIASEGLTEINYWSTHPEYDDPATARRSLLVSEIQNELLKRYEKGVCCFSSVVDNALLWSHYGDQHHGFCVGYDTNRTPTPIFKKVLYGGDRKILTSLIVGAIVDKQTDSIDLLDQMVLLRKASAWRYEREWRLIGSRGLQESPLLMKDITFGLRCPDAIRYTVTSTLGRRQELSFYEMYQVPKSFKLKRRRLDVEELNRYLPCIAESGEEMFAENPF